jgi:hypothetical protein
MTAVASLRYGVIFKKAFSRPDIFKAFVKDILGIELQIDHVETEKSFESAIGSVDSRFDLFAEDKVNRRHPASPLLRSLSPLFTLPLCSATRASR